MVLLVTNLSAVRTKFKLTPSSYPASPLPLELVALEHDRGRLRLEPGHVQQLQRQGAGDLEEVTPHTYQ